MDTDIAALAAEIEELERIGAEQDARLAPLLAEPTTPRSPTTEELIASLWGMVATGRAELDEIERQQTEIARLLDEMGA